MTHGPVTRKMFMAAIVFWTTWGFIAGLIIGKVS